MTDIRRAIEKQARMEADPDTSPADVYDHALRQLKLAREALRQATAVREAILMHLLHGDDHHRQWLEDEIELIFGPQDRALQAWADHVNGE